MTTTPTLAPPQPGGGSPGTADAADVPADVPADVAVSLRGLHKSFGSVNAVVDLDLDIARGEFFSMLGPSGSGKTTVLRLIAGFEQPTAGTIRLDGVDVTKAAPFDRDVNTVFQDYALFPHMTIADNVGYGLTVRRVPKSERRRMVAEALEQVRLGHVGGRRPSQLSGGQRQRIALARALILRPKVLLLDEPLGALDKQLREEMQVELKQIQREVGITFIFVTHDQEEAMTLSDRVAVFNHGSIEQLGPPDELYERPATEFVAGFLGVSNLIPRDTARALLGVDRMVSIRPERIRIGHLDGSGLDGSGPDGSGPDGSGLDRSGLDQPAPDQPAPDRTGGDTVFEGTISEAVYTGAATKFYVALDGGAAGTTQLICSRQNVDAASAGQFRRGERVRISWHPTDAYLVPSGTTPDPVGGVTAAATA